MPVSTYITEAKTPVFESYNKSYKKNGNGIAQR